MCVDAAEYYLNAMGVSARSLTRRSVFENYDGKVMFSSNVKSNKFDSLLVLSLLFHACGRLGLKGILS